MIEIGKKYRLRGTQDNPGEPIRRVLAVDCLGAYPVCVELADGTILKTNIDGTNFLSCGNDHDLIEWPLRMANHPGLTRLNSK